MARPNIALIKAIRQAAKKIDKGNQYQWGHMGACNCGHLAQEITSLTKTEIHEYAMRKYGDWTEQSMDYCPTSGQPLDLVISQMMAAGLAIEDLHHLEKLSDPDVLRQISLAERDLKHNVKKDVVNYMLLWANLLEDRITADIKLPELNVVEANTASN